MHPLHQAIGYFTVMSIFSDGCNLIASNDTAPCLIYSTDRNKTEWKPLNANKYIQMALSCRRHWPIPPAIHATDRRFLSVRKREVSEIDRQERIRRTRRDVLRAAAVRLLSIIDHCQCRKSFNFLLGCRYGAGLVLHGFSSWHIWRLYGKRLKMATKSF